jgi:hypothetical protein
MFFSVGCAGGQDSANVMPGIREAFVFRMFPSCGISVVEIEFLVKSRVAVAKNRRTRRSRHRKLDILTWGWDSICRILTGWIEHG